MTRLVGLSQRVVENTAYPERRDALDQRWARYLAACRMTPLPLPNDLAATAAIIETVPIVGVILTGGNDIPECGGDVPERDATEELLIDRALAGAFPLLGVCRGMQMIQRRFGADLLPVAGHADGWQTVVIDGVSARVNSFHRFGARTTPPPLTQWASAADGVVKAIRHRTARIEGIMWHPEREWPFALRDVDYTTHLFQEGKAK